MKNRSNVNTLLDVTVHFTTLQSSMKYNWIASVENFMGTLLFQCTFGYKTTNMLLQKVYNNFS